MNRNEAIKALEEGKVLTHPSFSKGEWVKQTGFMYGFEDGTMCTPEEFWIHRKYLETQWEVVSDFTRWNFELGDNEILCCKDLHEKGQPCEYTRVEVEELIKILGNAQGSVAKLERLLENQIANTRYCEQSFNKLRSDFDKLQAERDQLAAHAKRLSTIIQAARNEYIQEHDDCETDCVTPFDVYETPAQSLQILTEQERARAYEYGFGDGHSWSQDNPDYNAAYAKQAAKQYAKGGE